MFDRWLSRTTLLAAVFACVSACGAARVPAAADAAFSSSCRSAIDADNRSFLQEIRWHDAAAADADDLARWCDAVGPAVIDRDADAPAASSEMGEKFAVVSWNVHVGGGDVRALVRELRGGALLGEPVTDFVLLLQEAYRGGAAVPAVHVRHAGAARILGTPVDADRDDVVAIARSLGLSLYYVPSMRNGLLDDGPGEDRGNAILSTRPLRDFAAIELPFERQRRVAIAATLDGVGPDGRLRVISAHLDASASARRLWVFTSGLRERQARSLTVLADGARAAVAGSDLNTWVDGRREPAVRVMQQAFASTPPLTDRPTVALGFTLDYLFFRLPARWHGYSTRVDRRYGSDHHPLVGVVYHSRHAQ